MTIIIFILVLLLGLYFVFGFKSMQGYEDVKARQNAFGSRGREESMWDGECGVECAAGAAAEVTEAAVEECDFAECESARRCSCFCSSGAGSGVGWRAAPSASNDAIQSWSSCLSGGSERGKGRDLWWIANWIWRRWREGRVERDLVWSRRW